jgi:catechol 2,3-dioxygenase-like lactoylglutathione lyase family enzyme
VKLNHINLTVTDVRAAASFLESYFGLRPRGGNAGMMFLSDDDGMTVSLTKASRSDPLTYPGNFHIGFFIDSEAVVDELNQRLKADGFDVAPPERRHAYGFYVDAPGGFAIEVGA